MTDSTTTEEAPAKRGRGAGKPGPAVVVNGANFEEYFPPTKPKIGAPTTYTEEMADRLCDWVSEGRTLSSFCKLASSPDIQTVYNWQRAHPDFFAKYARAKLDGADRMAESVVEFSTVDLPPEKVQAARLAFDARKWYVSKISPRIWGDRVDIRQEISGPNGQPIQIQVQALLGLIENPQVMEKLSDAQVEAIRAAALALAAPASPAADGAGPVIDGEAVELDSDQGGVDE